MKSLTTILASLSLISCSEVHVAKIHLIQPQDIPIANTAVRTSLPAPNGSSTISFSSLPTQIRRSNPHLAAARHLINEAQGKLRQSGLASNPELEIEFEADRQFHDLMLTVGVSRKFPRTNRLLLEKKASAILIQAAQAEINDIERRLIGEAKLALVKILSIREEKKLLLAQQQNARELATSLEAAALQGEASLLDSGLAELEATRLGNRSDQLDIREQLALNTLKPLLGIKPQATLTISDTLPKPVIPPLLVASGKRPDLQAARLRARNAAALTAVEQTKKYDDIEAGIFAGIGRTEDAPGGLESEQTIGFRVKIPFPYYNDNLGAVLEADAKSNRLRLEADALQRTIVAQAAAHHTEMKQWAALAEKIQTKLIPLAEQQITKTKEAHSQGQVPLQDVLRAQEQKLSLQTSRLQALRDFHLARINYQTTAATK